MDNFYTKQPNESLSDVVRNTGLSVDQLQQYNPNLVSTRDASQINIGPTKTTMKDIYTAPVFESTQAPLDQFYSSQINQLQGDINQPINEDQIRRDKLSQFQAQIDATNQIYADQLRQAQQQGQSRLGSTAAIQGRRGLLGSDFGASQVQNITQANTDAENLVRQEQALAIQQILGKASQEAVDEIAAKRQAKAEGLQSYLAYLAGAEERKNAKTQNVVQTLLTQNISPDQLSPEDITNLRNSGISIQDIKTQYTLAQQQAEAEAQKAALEGQFNLSEGQARYDANGNIIAQRAKTYAPKDTASIGGGSIYEQLGSKVASAVVSQADKFAATPIVKKYNELVATANLINSVDPNTANPADHQAVIYNFAKALDPESVVREGEYATVKKYSQSLTSKYGGEIKQALSGKGFLSPGAIQDIQKATNQRLTAYTPQYSNLRNETARRIDSIAGAPISDTVLLDFTGGITEPVTQSTLPVGTTGKTSSGVGYTIE